MLLLLLLPALPAPPRDPTAGDGMQMSVSLLADRSTNDLMDLTALLRIRYSGARRVEQKQDCQNNNG
jgi:hypothetical protein